MSTAAQDLAVAKGGLVFGQQSSQAGDAEATLVLKVPPDQLRSVLDGLAALGEEQDRAIDTEDVTAASVDLEARIVSAEKSVERVRTFLDQTKNINELSGFEAELTRRETELEQLVGQRRQLNDQVALATVTFHVSTTPEVVVATSEPGDFLKGVPGFGSALASGTNWLVNALRAAAAGLGYALPFVVVLAIPLVALQLQRRRRTGLLQPEPTA